MDREAITKTIKGIFGCTRKMVASDSTYRRVLGWLQPQQIGSLFMSFRKRFGQDNLLQRKLIPHGASRRLGILDGTCMGGHWLVTLCLTGKINYPALTRPYRKTGDELSVARNIIADSPHLLGPSRLELWLMDDLYFNNTTFDLIRGQNAHLLIKVEKPEFREVLCDAQNLFQNFGGIWNNKGFTPAGCASLRPVRLR